MNIFSVLNLLCGLAFFLFGMQVMSRNLERLAGGKLESTLKRMTSSPLLSLGLGTVFTAVVQSSSAVTVMLVGLVNSGIMHYSQTLNVIFGTNIGTTLTAWLLGLTGIESDTLVLQLLKPKNFSPVLAVIGVFMTMLGKKERSRGVGNILVGFAILMTGMEFMSDAVKPLADMPEFAALMVRFRNPAVGVVVGALFTALIQSSSASVGILQALALTGSITYGMALPIIMGQNIGTCITAVMSCVGANAGAKSVAMLHTLINLLGTVILLPLYLIGNALFHFPFTNLPIDAWGIALLHTLFNIISTVILMPNGDLILRLTRWLVRESGQGSVPAEPGIAMLDERLLQSPSVAVQECLSYTQQMCRTARDLLRKSLGLLVHYDESEARQVAAMEDALDLYEDRLGSFLVKLSSCALSRQDSQSVSLMLHTIGDFERLGDHGIHLQKAAGELQEKRLSFSPEAQQDLRVLANALDEILKLTTEAFLLGSVQKAGHVEPLEEVIDRLCARVKDHHIQRLRRGVCTIEVGLILSELLNDCRRISDHCSNIAVAVIEVDRNSFDTHQYLQDVRYSSETFRILFERFAKKYAL